MGSMRRFDQAGAVFSEDMTNLQDLRDRGTITGNPVIVDSPYGRATSFTAASSQYWKQPDGDFRSGDTAGTVSAWITPAAIGSNEVWLSSSDEAGANNFLAFYILSSGYLAIYARISGSTTSVRGSTVLQAGSQYHVCATSSGTAWSICLNGTPESITVIDGSNTGNWFGDVPGRDNLCIGALQRNTISNYFGGTVRAVSIWNRELSTTEVSQLAAQTVWDYDLSLVSKWDMSEINPQDVGYKGNGNNGTGTGLVASTDIVTGPYGGYALEFNGTDEVVSVTAGSSLTFGTDSFSVSCLFSSDDITAASKGLVCNSTSAPGTGTGWWMYVNSSSLFVYVDDGSSFRFTADAGIANTKWAHACMVVDRSDNVVRLYIDGVLEGTSTSIAGYGAFDQSTIYIGRGQNFFNGRIADVRVHGNALSDIQVADLHQRLMMGRA